jgi:SAM-dependent methyltransferase
MAQFSVDAVREYYDRNTRAFVARGEGGSAGAIHRAVWGPGVHTHDEAFHYVEERVIELVRRLPLDVETPHVVDLGCGVGASLAHIARQLPGVTGTGVTLSAVQARLAADRMATLGLARRVSCLEADFCSLPSGLKPVHVAYAIEAFVHASSPQRFLAECRKIVAPHGALAICDDFRRRGVEPQAETAVERFRRGWRVNTLLFPDELTALAREAGFRHESTADLTPYLELDRPRDRAVGLLVKLIGWLPLYSTSLGYLIGGNALQQCLACGWLGYDFVVLRRVA